MIETTVPMIRLQDLQENPRFKNLMPPLSPEEHERLWESYRRHDGSRAAGPIVLNEKKEIIEGYNRVAIARALGIMEIPYVVVEGLSEQEQVELALDLNTARRQLTDHEIGEAIKRAKGVVEREQPQGGRPPEPGSRRQRRAATETPTSVGVSVVPKAAIDREVAARTGKSRAAVERSRQRAASRIKDGAEATRQKPARPTFESEMDSPVLNLLNHVSRLVKALGGPESLKMMGNEMRRYIRKEVPVLIKTLQVILKEAQKK